MKPVVASALLSALYLAVAIAHTWPLVTRLGSHLPGLELGDNVTFIWNFWWMRQAMHSPDLHFLQSPAILAPLGGPLVLHTHTALVAWFGATVLSQLTVVQAYNVTLLTSLVLNGLSAYALAFEVTRRRLPACISGLLFLLSPSITQRLMGHLNLVLAWPFVFFCVGFIRWWNRPRWLSAGAWALALTLTAYCDYYYVVYAGLFALGWAVINTCRVTFAFHARRSRLWIACAGLALVASIAGAAIMALDRDTLLIGGIAVSTRTPRNAFSAAWILLVVAALIRWRITVVSVRQPVTLLAVRGAHAAAAIALVAICTAPLGVASWRLWTSGQYITQSSALKSSPTGIDVATLALGPPFNGLLGERIRLIYSRFGLDAMDGSAWLGLLGLLTLGWAYHRRRNDSDITKWLLIACGAGVWALGPYLMVLGANTGVLLPQALAHLIPIVNNARMPSRAMMVVELSGAVLAAILISRHASSWSRAASIAMVVVSVEFLAAPLPMIPLPDPGVYRTIAADSTGGAVLPVPFGVGDGLGNTGVFDRDALYQQTLHGHPLAGGFLARLPSGVRPWYLSHEPYATLVALSERDFVLGDQPGCEAASSGLRRANVRYVVLYRSRTSTAAKEFVTTRMPVSRVAEDNERILYRVVDCHSDTNGR